MEAGNALHVTANVNMSASSNGAFIHAAANIPPSLPPLLSHVFVANFIVLFVFLCNNSISFVRFVVVVFVVRGRNNRRVLQRTARQEKGDRMQ